MRRGDWNPNWTERLSRFADDEKARKLSIVSFTWFYVPVHPAGLAAEPCGQRYLSWVYASGQKSRKRRYAPLTRVGSARWRESGRLR